MAIVTSSLQIVGEEHKLRKTGKLASLTQVKEFWEFMLSPTKVTTLSPPQKPRPFPPDEDEDETSNSWAITALPRGHSPWRKVIYLLARMFICGLMMIFIADWFSL